MNQPTPNQSPVQALVNRLESYLVTQNYTVDTLRHYRHVWRQLACYADEKGIVTADAEWMTQFLREHYGISDGIRLPERKKPITAPPVCSAIFSGMGMYCVAIILSGRYSPGDTSAYLKQRRNIAHKTA
jgi:hypothetical protein